MSAYGSRTFLSSSIFHTVSNIRTWLLHPSEFHDFTGHTRAYELNGILTKGSELNTMVKSSRLGREKPEATKNHGVRQEEIRIVDGVKSTRDSKNPEQHVARRAKQLAHPMVDKHKPAQCTILVDPHMYEMYQKDLRIFRDDLILELAALEERVKTSKHAKEVSSKQELKQARRLMREAHRLKEEVEVFMVSEDGRSGRRRGPRWCWWLYLAGATLLLGLESLYT